MEKLKLNLLDCVKCDDTYALLWLREPPSGGRKRGKRKWVDADQVVAALKEGLIEIDHATLLPNGRLHIDPDFNKTKSLDIVKNKIAWADSKLKQIDDPDKKKELLAFREKFYRKQKRLEQKAQALIDEENDSYIKACKKEKEELEKESEELEKEKEKSEKE